jgi:hypothetical protein
VGLARFVCTPVRTVHTAEVLAVGSPTIPTLDRLALCWRLLSPNNRQLGRSVATFDDVDSCLAAVRHLVAELAELEPVIVRTSRPVRWSWRALLHDEPVAVSARTFESERQAGRTLDIFLADAPLASVAAGVLPLPAPRPTPVPADLREGA